MPPANLLTDDYVASILAKDAKAGTAKYSSYGLNALLPKRPTTNAPKPNTRFLKNIIKETDNHNAALRAKEREEARSRLRRFHTEKEFEREPKRYDEDYGRLKRRRLDLDVEEDSDVQRKHTKSESHKIRDGDRGHRRSSRRERLEESGEKEESKYSKRRKEEETDSRRRSRKHGNGHYDSIDGEDGHRSGRHRYHHRSHRRYRSKEGETESKKSKHGSLSPSPRHHHHRSQQRYSYSPTPPLATNHLVNGKDEAPPPSPSSTSSDPLTTLLGPPPPPPAPLPRGRGTTTALDFSSTIDTHFSPTYKPSLDTPPNPSLDHDDWDLALEGLRDRQRWKAVGAERLRKAGWGDDVVDAWSKGGKASGGAEEGDVDSVKWKGRGEGREWDRGKVITEEGVETEVEWGRLKGT